MSRIKKSETRKEVKRQAAKMLNQIVAVKTQKHAPKVFYNKRCSENFAKFTGKHLCQSLFFNKVAGLRPATLLKMTL